MGLNTVRLLFYKNQTNALPRPCPQFGLPKDQHPACHVPLPFTFHQIFAIESNIKLPIHAEYHFAVQLAIFLSI